MLEKSLHCGRGTISIKSIDELPCKGQSDEAVRAWVDRANLKVGDEVVVRVGCGGMYNYYRTRLVAVNHTRQRRLVVEPSAVYGASFYRNGKNCFEPTGQKHLVEPTSEVVKAATEGITYFHLGGSFYI